MRAGSGTRPAIVAGLGAAVVCSSVFIPFDARPEVIRETLPVHQFVEDSIRAGAASVDPSSRTALLLGPPHRDDELRERWPTDGPPSDGGWTPHTGPRRALHSAVFDPLTRSMIVFGGVGPGLVYPDDVWVMPLDGPPVWSRFPVEGDRPTPRVGHTAIFDPKRRRMIVYGGVGDGRRSDVWALTLDEGPKWTEILPSGPGPVSRFSHSAVYDPIGDRMIIYGGSIGSSIDDGSPGTCLGDIWALTLGDHAEWTEISVAGSGPAPRFGHAALFDPAAGRMVIHGGFAGDCWFDGRHGGCFTQGDVWELSLSDQPVWTEWPQPFGPAVTLQGHTSVLDAEGGRGLLFGGRSHQSGNGDDVWALNLNSRGVELPAVEGTVDAIGRGSSAIFDPVARRMLIFGGGAGGMFPSRATWALDSRSGGLSWFRLPDPPPQNGGAGSVTFLDSGRSRILALRKGEDGRAGLYERPADLSGPFVPVPTMGEGPLLVAAPSWIIDSKRHRLVIFGGLVQEYPYTWEALAEVWELSLDTPHTWRQLHPQGATPPERWGHSAAYDPVRDRMIVFGGRNRDSFLADTWELSFAPELGWVQLVSETPDPGARVGHSTIYDPIGDRLIVFGGETNEGQRPGDTWALTLDGPARWTLTRHVGQVPGVRTEFGAFFHAGLEGMVVVGGILGTGHAYTDAWMLNLVGEPTWRPMHPAGGPLTGMGSTSYVYDPGRDVVEAFGFDDHWTLSWGLPTLPVNVVVEPVSRSGHGASGGRLEVALLGAAGFDARTVDPASLAVVYEGRRAMAHQGVRVRVHDVNADGMPDILVTVNGDDLDLPVGISTIRVDAMTIENEHVRGWDRLAWTRRGRPGPRAGVEALPDRVQMRCRGPQPSGSELRVDLALTTSEMAEIECLDVHGRRILGREVGNLGPGHHSISLDVGRSLRAGLYFLRLRQGVASSVAKLVVLD